MSACMCICVGAHAVRVDVEHGRRLHGDQGSKVILFQTPRHAWMRSVVLRWGEMGGPLETKSSGFEGLRMSSKGLRMIALSTTDLS